MSERALEYVLGLGPDEVTVTEKNVLRAIAEYHSERFGSANVDLDTISRDTLLTVRYLRKVFSRVRHLIDYRPGLGRGNVGQFKFLALQPVEIRITDGAGKRSKSGPKPVQKGPLSVTAIRKDLNLNPDQEQNGLPISSSSSDDRDDDIEFNYANLEQFESIPPNFKPRRFETIDVERVLTAFNDSPVVMQGRRNGDRLTAEKLLQLFSYEEIKRGIVLATARRMCSDLNRSQETKVASLAYFVQLSRNAGGTRW